jgi:uncharacterized protein YqeY
VSVLSELQESVKTALKAGDKERVAALRMVVCELQKEAKRTQLELDGDTEFAVLRRELKRREESIEAFRAGGREDLAAHEEFAAHIVEDLLPKQMDEAELSGLIDRAHRAGSGSTASWPRAWSRSVYPREKSSGDPC